MAPPTLRQRARPPDLESDRPRCQHRQNIRGTCVFGEKLHCATMRGKTSVGVWSGLSGTGGCWWSSVQRVAVRTRSTSGATIPREAPGIARRPQLWTLFDIHKALPGRTGRWPPPRASPAGFRPTLHQPRGRRHRHPEDHTGLQRGRARRLRLAGDLGELRRDLGPALVRAGHRLERARAPPRTRSRAPNGEDAPPVFDVAPAQPVLQPVLAGVLRGGARRARPATSTPRSSRSSNDGLPIYPRRRPGSIRSRPEPSPWRAKPVHPYLQKPVAAFLREFPGSWVDDEAMPYFDEGFNNFKYDANAGGRGGAAVHAGEARTPTASRLSSARPHVIGTGPLLARRPAELPNGRPRFGSSTRFHIAIVPAHRRGLRSRQVPRRRAPRWWPRGWIPRPTAGGWRATRSRWPRRDRSCFDAAGISHQLHLAGFAGAHRGRRWASSNIRRTEVGACSPVVFYGGKGIGR